MFLTTPDLVALTGKRQPAAQRRALDRMGIKHRVRPDGVPVVCAIVLTGDLAKDKLAALEPNWSAL